MKTNEIAPYQPAPAALIPYSDLERMATAIARSRLFGVTEPAQAIALCLIAQAEGLHPAIAARDYSIIQGRPAKTAEAIQRAFLAAGGRIEWHRLDDTLADATFAHPQGGTFRCTWDLDRARQAGLGTKENWKKYPRAMLRARCVSEGCRTVYPGATSGMYTPEETRDMVAEKDVPGEVVSLHPPTPEPEPGIGAGSREHKALEARIAELDLARDRVKDWVKRAWNVAHFPDLTAAQYRKLLERLPEFAAKRLLALIDGLSTADLEALIKTPPAYLRGEALTAVLQKADARLMTLSIAAQETPHEPAA